MRLRRPGLRDIASFLLSLIIALVGVVGVILFFEARDESKLEGPRGAPGLPYEGDPALPPQVRAALARGNVVILHRDRLIPPGTLALAEGAGPELRAVGLAVIFRRDVELDTPLMAVADDRFQPGSSAAELRNFVDLHLGA